MKPLTVCTVLVVFVALLAAAAAEQVDEDAAVDLWEFVGINSGESTHDVNFTASSTDSGKIKMWGERKVHMNITAFIRPLDQEYQFAVYISSNDDSVCQVLDPEILLTRDCLTVVEMDGQEEDLHICEIEFGVYGAFLGRTTLNFAIVDVNLTEEFVKKVS